MTSLPGVAGGSLQSGRFAITWTQTAHLAARQSLTWLVRLSVRWPAAQSAHLGFWGKGYMASMCLIHYKSCTVHLARSSFWQRRPSMRMPFATRHLQVSSPLTTKATEGAVISPRFVAALVSVRRPRHLRT